MDVATLILEIRSLSPDERRQVWEAVRSEEPVEFADVMSDEDVREVNRLLDLDDAGLLTGEPLAVVPGALAEPFVKLPIVVTHQAEVAVTAAEAWYESKRTGAGVTFRERVEELLEDIADQPGRFTPGVRNTRIAKVRGYQFLVVFREHVDHILVLAVVHSRSGTSNWLPPP